jgi:hypothetical protein
LVVIWNILWLFGIFFRFGMFYQEKSGNPGRVFFQFEQVTRLHDMKLIFLLILVVIYLQNF